MTWFDDMHQRAHDEAQRPQVISIDESGSRLLVLERGARLLACELPGLDHNPFFDTSCLSDDKLTGGDRLWIAPEAAFFWPSLDDALRDPKGTAETPAAIDPAVYEARLFDGGITLELADHSAELHDKRSGTKARQGWKRTIEFFSDASPDPQLTTASFAIRNRAICYSQAHPDYVFPFGCWDILQVPVGGTLICPTTMNVGQSDRYTAGEQSHCQTPDAGPRSYYDPFGDKHVVVEDQCVRFLIDGKRRVKMGLLPDHTTGRMGYYRRLDNGKAVLILRLFASFPGEPYCDLPINHPAHAAAAEGRHIPEACLGDALQAYNDDGDAFPGTSFGEMEYHNPCVMPGVAPTSRIGNCVTHVMAGPDDTIKRAGRELLGVEVRGIG